MKRSLSVLFILCMLITLTSCVKKSDPEPTSSHAVTDAPETGSEDVTEEKPEIETEDVAEADTEFASEVDSETEPAQVSDTETIPEEPDPTPVSDEELYGIFEEILKIHPGSAGSSISADVCAVKLLDWGAGTQLNDGEIRSATETWLEEKNETDRELFKESIRTVRASLNIVRDRDREFILNHTGIDSEFCPWDDRAFGILETVFTACGLE